jgi:hypothetical protein
MESFSALAAHPLVLALMVLVALMFVVGLLKRLFKLAFFALLIFLLVVAYYQVTGKEMPEALEGATKKMEEVVKTVSDKAPEFIDDAVDQISEKTPELLESAGDAIEAGQKKLKEIKKKD